MQDDGEAQGPATGRGGEPGGGTAEDQKAEDGPACERWTRSVWLSSSGWHRPLCTLATFLCANAIFWFLALSTMRVYSLLPVFIIVLLLLQLIVDMVLSRMKGLPVWRSVSFSWEVITAKSDCRPWLGQCMAESWTNYRAFLQEMSHFKQQHPGMFCLLVCSLCTFFAILGSYIPGVVLSYFMLLCAFFCPLLKCHECGQKVFSKLKPVLQKLDFGVWSFLCQWRRERAEKASTRICEDDRELDIATLYPEVSCSSLLRELSVTDTEASEISLTDNGTFNLSGGYTPQTDTSDDFDRTSDQEDAFIQDLSEFPNVEMGTGSGTDDSSIGLPTQQNKRKERHPVRSSRERHLPTDLSLPLTNDLTFGLISGIAEDFIATAVSAAITGQIQMAQQATAQPNTSPSECSDTEEVDDFELLDQSELEEIEEARELTPGKELEEQGKKAKRGFFSNLLGGQ
ncbi:reticulophagy regulator 1 [Ambystoma mexicanum]|uniref:reticulophagy regulator 1 n=1 Tax=Ambystoma mexicanum TaxID=8296 RepID=UPI0037E7082B